MRNLLIIILLAATGISMAMHFTGRGKNEQVLTSKTVTQVAVIVRDIDKARHAWAEVLGVPVPEAGIAEGHSSRPTRYKGDLSDAKALLAFISMDNLQIEIIQPLGGKSTWQDYLDRYGEGIHHIAFQVKDINNMEKKFALQGMPAVMNGGWDGGAYSYIDATSKLGCVLELLENYR